MRKSRFKIETIIQILGEAQIPGVTIAEICRKYGVSRSTFDNWKRKYQGMSAEEAKRIKQLESENAMLKRLLAEKEMDLALAKDLLKKN
jgi:putative transposase